MTKLTFKTILFVVAVVAGVSGCGVRGRPQPPETPPEIGRGQPTFRRATEALKFQNVPPVPSDSGSSLDGEDPGETDSDEESGSR